MRQKLAKKTRLEKDFEGILMILEQIGCEGVGDDVYTNLIEALKDPANNTALAILCDTAKRVSITLDIIYTSIVLPKSQNSVVFKQILDSYKTTSNSAKAVANIKN